ncbi:MAG: beta-galactosidase trimerization domain-containing protein, partial [Acidobacteria bacterium]|nr:beta-galactosidase trimerization domain-containing protein [Acidobacteriota bacterium]
MVEELQVEQVRDPEAGVKLAGRLLWAGALLAGWMSAQTPARWWEKEPLTILDLHTFAGEITRFPAPELARLKATLGFNTDTLYVHNLFDGMDDEGFFFRTPLAARQHPDNLKEFLPEARKRGMRTTLYFNVHYFTMEFARQHPDWVQIREEGGIPDKMYGHGTTLCVNGPWRDWVAALMKDLSAYPIDGIFVDGPMFLPETCYCQWCRAKFRKLYGRDLPSKRQRQGRGASELLNFQGISLADFMRDLNRVLKAANPNILLYGNHTALTGNWGTGQVNRLLVKEQDLLASEGGYVYNDLNRTPLWKAGLRARMIETQAGGKPTVIIACPALKPWTHAMLPAAEARLMFADSIANGAGVWMSLTLTEFDRPELQATVAMNRFVKENAQYLHKTRSEAKVALVWSYATANAYSPDAQLIDMASVESKTEAGNLQREFWGVAEALLRAHVPFDVIDDDTLEQGELERYRAVFLPNAACMSDEAARRLTSYVRNGGGLFATFETSLYDPLGQRRQEFALREAMGV